MLLLTPPTQEWWMQECAREQTADMGPGSCALPHQHSFRGTDEEESRARYEHWCDPMGIPLIPLCMIAR